QTMTDGVQSSFDGLDRIPDVRRKMTLQFVLRDVAWNGWREGTLGGEGDSLRFSVLALPIEDLAIGDQVDQPIPIAICEIDVRICLGIVEADARKTRKAGVGLDAHTHC